jgi:ATP-dependent Clp protease ATP-binding subunit ClpA
MVVSRAEQEAQLLGHDQIGTEHLLLGIVADERSSACQTLVTAGATLDGCRSKVREAVGPTPSVARVAKLELSDRARRALERADRLSLRRRDERVEPDHVLLSVLDVEGRAGQVLRGLGVDVVVLRDSVLSAIDKRPQPSTEAGPKDPEPVPRCVACGSALDDTLSHRVVASRDAGHNRRDFVVAYCSSCGAAVGATPR